MNRAVIPPRLVCRICGRDEVTVMPVADGTLWRYSCLEDGYSWDKKVEREFVGHEGIMSERGLFDDLPRCLNPGEMYVEHGVVEYRYKLLRPEVYADLVRIYGHVSQGPKKYTVTAFLAQALGHLLRSGVVAWADGPATGFFSYNRRVGYWALHPGPSDGSMLSWDRFAAAGGHDPNRWELFPPNA